MTYSLPNSWNRADTRLSLLEQSHDRISRRRLLDAGVEEGWRCLEVGAGAGSIAYWLADQVGASGSVHAVDRDCSLLGEGRANLTVAEADLTTTDLGTSQYDLVHARLVLMFLPERTDVLEKLVQALRPNGVLLIEEYDCYPVEAAADEPFRSSAMFLVQRLESLGASFRWGRGLPSALSRLELDDVTAEEDVPLFRGRSTMANFLSLTWKQILDDMAEEDIDGVTAAGIDQALHTLADPHQWFRGFGFTCARGIRR